MSAVICVNVVFILETVDGPKAVQRPSGMITYENLGHSNPSQSHRENDFDKYTHFMR